jgi:proteic killer suppression protein
MIFLRADRVDILFRDQKLAKVCNNERQLIRKYGAERAKLLRRRLDELRAAENLNILCTLPQVRCHELKGNRKGTLAVDGVTLTDSFLNQLIIQYQ